MISKLFRVLRSLLQRLYGLACIGISCSIGVIAVLAIFIEELPLGEPSTALTATPETKYLDNHVHIAGLGYGDSGCFVNEVLVNSYKFRFFLKAFDVTLEELKTEGDELVVSRLSKKIGESKFIDKAVILAMDGVIDKDGELDKTKTQVYIPNEFVARQVAKHQNFKFGASINPYRRDALERLQEAKQSGAVLVKWIPSIMGIDPSDKK